MAYKVRYGINRHDKAARAVSARKWTSLILALILPIGAFLLSRWGASFDWLLPGDPGVTGTALEELRQSIASGEPLGEAVTAFCREIIDGAVLAE